MTKTEPVLLNGTAASIAAAGTTVLVYAGINANDAGRYGSLAGAGLAFVLVLWHLFSARSKVTPVANGDAVDTVSAGVQVIRDALTTADDSQFYVPDVEPTDADSLPEASTTPPSSEVPVQAG